MEKVYNKFYNGSEFGTIQADSLGFFTGLQPNYTVLSDPLDKGKVFLTLDNEKKVAYKPLLGCRVAHKNYITNKFNCFLCKIGYEIIQIKVSDGF